MCVKWTCCFLFAVLLTVSTCEVLKVREGESVTLNIRGHVDKNNLIAFEWSVNNMTIADYRNRTIYIDPHFKGRVEFDEDTFSLGLGNLMKNDSGHYTAVRNVYGKPKEMVADYSISVLEHAAAPTLTVVSNWSSSDSCNVTLNCTGLNVSLISSCDGTFCSQEGRNRFLSISLNHATVSCNHSNPVSWNQTLIELEPLCQLSRKRQTRRWTIEVIFGIVACVGLISAVMIVAAIYWWHKSRDHNIQVGHTCSAL
ncbi:hypothetical protein AALO_G00310020 [Alosa alosa]|uniref:Immunoglobulin subtype domain-containing protein n=1 Tax=Alosa alosa TaxID=278164 RepID=A0AAV6FD90_9TELE|nr:hypothetical protein AALO_G00310020 [Alosa alosa]